VGEDRQAFFDAIEREDLDEVRALLERKPELSRAQDEEGRTGLLLAIYHGHHELVNFLSERRPEVDIFEAAAGGNAARVQELVREEPRRVEFSSPDGFSPLGLAALFGWPEVVSILLREGADPDVASKSAMRVTPLHSAAGYRDGAASEKICRELLTHGADPDARQAGGWTPLHQAAGQGNVRVVRLLLRYGADPQAAGDDGRTPEEMARENEHEEVVRVLREAAAAAG